MKKGMFVLVLLLGHFTVFSQPDSTKMIYCNGQKLDTTQTYISLQVSIFATPKKVETYWVGGMSLPRTNYGINLKLLWDDMIVSANKYELKNYKGEKLPIQVEDDLFNMMAKLGYRFLSKSVIPPNNMGLIAARSVGGNVYKFEKK